MLLLQVKKARLTFLSKRSKLRDHTHFLALARQDRTFALWRARRSRPASSPPHLPAFCRLDQSLCSTGRLAARAQAHVISLYFIIYVIICKPPPPPHVCAHISSRSWAESQKPTSVGLAVVWWLNTNNVATHCWIRAQARADHRTMHCWDGVEWGVRGSLCARA